MSIVVEAVRRIFHGICNAGRDQQAIPLVEVVVEELRDSQIRGVLKSGKIVG